MIDEPRRYAGETTRGTPPQGDYGASVAGATARHEAAWHAQQQPGRWALPSGLRRISWGAVIAGAAVAIVVQLTLNLLGLGIGALTIDPAAQQQQAVPQALGLSAALWWLGSVLIALFVGGWFAGYLAGTPERSDGAMHGIVTWSLATILSIWILTTAVGTVMSGAWNVMQGGLQAMDGQAAAQTQQPGQPQQPTDGAQAQQQQPMQQAQEAWQQMQQEGPQMAQQAAQAVAWASFWTFAALLLGAICAALGGMLGSPQDAPVTHRGYTHDRDSAAAQQPPEAHERQRERSEQERIERERAEANRTREQRQEVEREQEEYRKRQQRG